MLAKSNKNVTCNNNNNNNNDDDDDAMDSSDCTWVCHFAHMSIYFVLSENSDPTKFWAENRMRNLPYQNLSTHKQINGVYMQLVPKYILPFSFFFF
jgi:hypothetical protein